jgi:molybdate transport system permease protein
MASLRRYFGNLVSNGQYGWVFIIPSLLLAGLFGLPIVSLVVRAAGSDFFASISAASALQALRLSMVTSLTSLAVTLVFGTALSYLLARQKFPFKAWFELLIDLPIVLPPSVAGLALLMAFGRNGLFGPLLGLLGINLPFTLPAVVIAQTFVAAPLYVRAARIGFTEIDVQLEEAAYVEGANQWQLFREVMFPLAGNAILSGAILCWARALGEFGATILFAGNLEGVTQTMPLAIYIGLERSLAVAVALSVMLVGVSVVLLAATRRLEKKTESRAVGIG